MSRPRSIGVFGLTILILALSISCEPMPVPTSVAPTATRTATPRPTPTVTATPVTPVPTLPPIRKSGAVAIGTAPMTGKHLNPIWLTSAPQFLVLPLVLPALTWFDDKAQPIPDLASKVDVNADATVFTFTLPKNATWSDGTPLTAKDVVFTYKLALDPAIGSSLWGINLASIKGAAEYQKGAAKDIEGIKSVNDQTVRFELKESNATFLFNTYLGILPAAVLSQGDPSEIEKNPYVDWPTITAGPYDVAGYAPGQSIRLKKKSNYWGKPVALDEITVRFFDQPAAMFALLESGDVQVAALPLDQAARFRNLTNVDVLSAKGIGYVALHVDGRTKDQLAALSKPRDQGGGGYNVAKTLKPYLQDKRFRQALDYAIDRQALIQTVARGEATPIYSAIFGPDWAINPNLNKYDVNVDRAKALMKAVGITFDADGIAQWEGKPITLVYLASAGDDARRLGNALQQQLSKAGLRVEIKLVPSASFLDAAIQGQGDLIRNVGGRFGADPSASVLYYACKAGWAELVMGYCNPKFDELQGRGLAVSKSDDRKKVYWDASAILNDELPSIFLFAPNTLFVVNKGLTGIKPTADPNHLTWNIPEWAFQK